AAAAARVVKRPNRTRHGALVPSTRASYPRSLSRATSAFASACVLNAATCTDHVPACWALGARGSADAGREGAGAGGAAAAVSPRAALSVDATSAGHAVKR